ncbi:MAG: DUF488 domain-containing protein [Verrucomicrobiota bacterium]
MTVYTIGFTQKNARSFFETLRSAGVRRLIDVRLNNNSQLAGFRKRDDLAYFLEKILGINYLHEPLLAPTQSMLDAYKKEKGSWAEYEKAFIGLMEARRIENEIDPEVLSGSCLLCSEDKPHQCHRRLVLEYLANRWGSMEIKHLT